MGANIVPGAGVTFRVWAPTALAVYVSGDFNGWIQDESCRLVSDGQGIWTGFIAGTPLGYAGEPSPTNAFAALGSPASETMAST